MEKNKFAEAVDVDDDDDDDDDDCYIHETAKASQWKEQKIIHLGVVVVVVVVVFLH